MNPFSLKIHNFLHLMRPRQWIKNGFVVIPAFFGSKLGDRHAVTTILETLVVFCLISSVVYILNDLHDRSADAAHPKKRHRPIASGMVTPIQALALAAGLLAAVSIALIQARLPNGVLVCLAIYFCANLAYSSGLKRVSILELLLVASGYVIRVIAGAIAIDLVASSWLLAETGVIALLIVTAKRRGEIAEGHDPETRRSTLRHYNLTFLDSMISMLTGMTLVIYLLFTASEYAATRFGQNEILLTAPVVAYGVLRYVQLTKVGKGADDPTELVLRDPGIAIAVVIFALIFGAILYL